MIVRPSSRTYFGFLSGMICAMDHSSVAVLGFPHIIQQFPVSRKRISLFSPLSKSPVEPQRNRYWDDTLQSSFIGSDLKVYGNNGEKGQRTLKNNLPVCKITDSSPLKQSIGPDEWHFGFLLRRHSSQRLWPLGRHSLLKRFPLL